jgi:predicted ATPase
MINKIILENFKAFRERTELPLAKLTLLTGINGRGKSSMLQSLLLIHQYLDNPLQPNVLNLNGSCVNLGTVDDVRNRANSSDKPVIFEFEITQQDRVNVLRYILKANEKNKASLQIEDIPKKDDLRAIHFISAERFDAQLAYEFKDVSESFINLGGKKADKLVNVLFQKQDFEVPENLHIAERYEGDLPVKNISKALLTQTGEWLNRILEGNQVKVHIEEVSGNVLILHFKFGTSEYLYLPSNIGFGYSYMLPIVVAGLIAQPNDLLLIENPEAHLHPKAQSELMDFLVKVTQNRVQVVIETHSDHILNRALVEVKETLRQKKQTLRPEDVSILFFHNGKLEYSTEVIPLKINEKGKIISSPIDFFDQISKDLRTLTGF